MNIFELLNDVIFIEDENDITFVKEKLNLNTVKIGDVEKINLNNIKECKEYIVKPLDTITLVAKKLGVSEEVIKKQTGTTNLFVGQKLIFF